MEHNYATNSSVPVERSKAQIRGYLAQAGADGFGDVEQQGKVAMAFVIDGHRYQITFTLPAFSQFQQTPSGRDRCQREALAHHDRAVRSYWRTILLIIKANCEAIALGVMTARQAFGSMLVLGDGHTTVGEAVWARIESGELPKALPLL
jgi:hypothetical protein